jgi:uncharacterized protein (DUF1778 family)
MATHELETAVARSRTINIRARQQQQDLIDRAAKTLGKTRSEFMLDTACREAENVLLEQRLFRLDEDAFDSFVDALDAPVADNPKLRALLRRTPLWEKERER